MYCFVKSFPLNKVLLLAVCALGLSACKSSLNQGTSSHVAIGAVSYPLNSNKPTPKKHNPPPQQPAAPAVVNAATPVEKPAPVANSGNQIKVVVNPEAGQPLGESSELEVSSLKEAAPVLVSQEDNWLSRYPNLSEDLKDYQAVVQNLEQESKQYQQQVKQLEEKIKQNWRGTPLISGSAYQLVKYTDSYHSRGSMDFDSGKIVVETMEQNDPGAHLKTAILATLLMPLDAENPEIYSDKNITYEGPALLAGQVVDHEGKPVKWRWRAERYADYLVANKMQTVNEGGQQVYRIEIPLVENHDKVRGQKFEELVRKAAQDYQISEVLIYSIMEVESHFNPYATSHVPAYGLMQIVPSTAGKDVFTRIKKRNDQPTRNYLFNPANNIDAGTAYLSILRDNYLSGITNPLAREYAMISGYNGGAGNVLRTFHKDRKQAVAIINSLSPQQVYKRLHERHPSAEARGYIEKVTKAQQKYRTLAKNAF